MARMKRKNQSMRGPTVDDGESLAQRGAQEICLSCGYSLRGLQTRARCPECGQTADREKSARRAAAWFCSPAALLLWSVPPGAVFFLNGNSIRAQARHRIVLGIVIPTAILCVLSFVGCHTVAVKLTERWVDPAGTANPSASARHLLLVREGLLGPRSIDGYYDGARRPALGDQLRERVLKVSLEWWGSGPGFGQLPYVLPLVVAVGFAAGAGIVLPLLAGVAKPIRLRLPYSVVLTCFIIPCVLVQCICLSAWLMYIYSVVHGHYEVVGISRIPLWGYMEILATLTIVGGTVYVLYQLIGHLAPWRPLLQRVAVVVAGVLLLCAAQVAAAAVLTLAMQWVQG